MTEPLTPKAPASTFVIPYASQETDPPLRPLLYGTTPLFFCFLLLVLDYAYDMHFYGINRGGSGDPLSTYIAGNAALLLPILTVLNLAYTWARGRFDPAYGPLYRRRIFAGRLAFYLMLLQFAASLVLLSTPIFHN